MENRKRNVQIIVRVTEDERTLIEEKMRQIPTMNLSAYSRKMLIDGYIIVLDLQKVSKRIRRSFRKSAAISIRLQSVSTKQGVFMTTTWTS